MKILGDFTKAQQLPPRTRWEQKGKQINRQFGKYTNAQTKALLRSRAAKIVARNNFLSFRKTCMKVNKLRGAASGS